MSKTTSLVILTVIILAAISGGIWYSQSQKAKTKIPTHSENDGHAMEQPVNNADKQANQHMESMAGGNSHGTGVAKGAVLAGSRIDLRNINNLKPGKVDFMFRLYSIDAKELTPKELKEVHES